MNKELEEFCTEVKSLPSGKVQGVNVVMAPSKQDYIRLKKMMPNNSRFSSDSIDRDNLIMQTPRTITYQDFTILTYEEDEQFT